jgi:hypothetical protein
MNTESDSTWNHQKSRLARALTLPGQVDSAKKPEKLWQTYLDLCETFTSQGLTNSGDTLPALSSLSRKVSPYLGRYFAGLWEYNILIGLQWESLDGRRSSRHKSYVSPTFSWASRSGPVVWYISDTYLIPNHKECDFAEVLEIHCQPSTASPFGLVSDGFIRLRGSVTTMRFEDFAGCYSHGRLKLCRDDATAVSDAESEENVCFVCMDAIEDMLEARGNSVTCLDIMRDKRDTGYVSALVLVAVQGRPGIYRRVGFSTMGKNLFKGAQIESITII